MMGCDIHLYREKRVDGVWVSADEWTPDKFEEGRMEVDFHKRFTERNYELFGALSKGVRSEHPYSFVPRGVPFDASTQIKKEIDRWGCDGHSHSYLFLHELRAFRRFLDTQTVTIEGLKDSDGLAALRKSIESGSPDWKLLYPYWGGSNNPKDEHFEFAVPCSFSLGGSLDRIISTFDEVDGDLHRIVFWFDN